MASRGFCLNLQLKAVSDQVSWGFIQSHLWRLLKMRQCNLSGKSVQLFTVLTRRKAFPYFQSECLLMPVVCHYPIMHCCEETSSVFQPSLLGIKRLPWSLHWSFLVYRLNKCLSLSLSSLSKCSSPLSRLVAIHWAYFSLMVFFLCWGVRN